MDDAIGTTRPADPSLYTMHLGNDGTATMRLNCNRATGTWTAKASRDGKSGSFEFGPLAATRALCPPPSMDEHILAQAPFIRGYLLKDGKLYLSLMADGGIYAWEPDREQFSNSVVFAAPEEGGPRNWEVTGVTHALNLRAQPSVAAPLIASYPRGTILDNLGCRSFDNKVWCDVQRLGGGARGYVVATFLKPAVSPDGSIAIGPDDSALRASQGTFDATGEISCVQHSGQPIGKCEFGIARAGGGYATVLVKRAEGRTRAIFFRMGQPIGADISQADGSLKFSAGKKGNVHFVRIGNELYEIPDALIFGR